MKWYHHTILKVSLQQCLQSVIFISFSGFFNYEIVVFDNFKKHTQITLSNSRIHAMLYECDTMLLTNEARKGQKSSNIVFMLKCHSLSISSKFPEVPPFRTQNSRIR